VNGELSVQIKKVSKDQSYSGLNPSWFGFYQKKSNKSSEQKDHIIQEVEVFDEHDPHPSVNYVNNNLYINLLHLSVKSSLDTSIQVKVQFRRSDNTKIPTEKVSKEKQNTFSPNYLFFKVNLSKIYQRLY